MENVFVPKSHRGKKIMACGMALVAEKGNGTGCRWATTNVEAWNIASLRGCLAAGFHPYAFRRIRWRAFRREYSFAWLNEWQCRKLESLWRRGLLSEKGPNVDKKAAWRRAGAEICTRLPAAGGGT